MKQRTHDEVEGTRLGRDWHRRRNEPACNACHVAWNEISRQRQAARRAAGIRRKLSAICRCEQCGDEFKSDRRASRFCSRRCFGLSQRKGAALLPAPRRPHRRGFVAVIDLTPRKPRIWCSGFCAWCGTQFVVVHQTQARFCSRRCGKKAVRSRHGGRFKPSPVFRRAIYERDNWTCQLCRKPVDRDAHYLDPLAPSLDHIACRSWTLFPDHTDRNLRTAHRICNSIRGDETYAA